MLKNNEEKQLMIIKDNFFSKAFSFFTKLFTSTNDLEGTRSVVMPQQNTKKNEMLTLYYRIKKEQAGINKLSIEQIDMLNALADEEIKIKEANIKDKLKELVIYENEKEKLKKQIAKT